MEEVLNLGKETYAVYTGQATERFAPLLAGISHPDPCYEILRPSCDFYVFEYVISGRGTVRLGDEETSVCAGDAYILTPGKMHHYYPDKKEPWEKIWFNVGGHLVRHLLSDYGLESVLKISGFRDEEPLRAIMMAMRNDPARCGNHLAILLHEYMQALAAFAGQQSLESSRPLAMKNFIEQNLTVPLSINEIADHVHLSRSRANCLFREAYRDTPYHYYLSQRMELACSMLRYTTLSVEAISEELGFSDYHHFSGVFKKMYGISPMGYRKQRT